MAAEQGLAVDEEGFRRLMGEQRQRAKADARAKKGQHATRRPTARSPTRSVRPVEFTGYDEVVSEGSVRGIVADGGRAAAREGDEIELVLDRTPFYAEGGGQLADQGVIELANGARVQVLDVQSPITGLIVHQAKVLSGEVTVGAQAQALVDVERRRSITRAHTATHMVHKAFREALGETATQAGLGERAGPVPVRLLRQRRGAGLGDGRRRGAGQRRRARRPRGARRGDDPGRGARSPGAMALFGEKYGDQVRVVSVGDWARELCGGTHAGSSGQLGVVKLLGESSIGSGVRRVEALVGSDAYRFLAREHVLVAQLTETLKVRPEELPDRVNDMVERLRNAEKEIERVRTQQVLPLRGAWRPGQALGGRMGNGGGGDVRKAALDIRGRLGDASPAVDARRGLGAINGRPSTGRRRPTRRPARWGSAPTTWSASGPASWAAAVAARTTSPRVVAPTRARSTRRSPSSSTRSAKR